MRQQRVIVVSPQKSGTHLISELMVKLGYRTFGWVVMEDAPPEFSAAERLSAVKSIMGKWERAIFSVGRRMGVLKRLEQDAMAGLMLVWGERLGVPWASRHGLQAVHTIYSLRNLRALCSGDMTSVMQNICLVKHELPLDKIDGAFTRHWSNTGDPALVFMYRDPRDVLCSFVRYLTGRTAKGKHGDFAEYNVHQAILEALPDDDERLMHAITDPSFPGHRDYFDCLWLLRHPKVCKASYEELVGEQGGGSEQAQRAAVTRVLDHLGIDAEAEDCAKGIYRTDSFTYSRGQVGSWKEMFKPRHHKAFERHFGDILASYGYEPGGREPPTDDVRTVQP